MIVCRGSLGLGTACGTCQRCKAAAWDWLVENVRELDYWAVMETGQHNPMLAVIKNAVTQRSSEPPLQWATVDVAPRTGVVTENGLEFDK